MLSISMLKRRETIVHARVIKRNTYESRIVSSWTHIQQFLE